ncbi:MAG: hypothetical protein KA754_01085 [Corallincola sp.]|nr:hypothetical protein [Corallincola sp.]
MNGERFSAFVTKADGNIIRLKLNENSISNILSDLGFVYDETLSEYTLTTSGAQEKARVFEKLRAAGVCFSAGKEWCPAEVFEYLRDKGLLSGSFKKISWRGPDDYHITVE